MFLPVCKQDLLERGIESLDFIMITGEAYVDHPSFGHAIISRYIESQGFSVGIISQPQSKEDYTKFGRPNFAFLISSGVIDSMVNNYTVSKKKRSKDVYSAGGVYGLRPDRATEVYTHFVKKLYPDCYCIAGGIEVSLRKFAHYDYWSDEVMASSIVRSGYDLGIYGMGEAPFKDILTLVKRGVPIERIKDVAGTFYLTKEVEKLQNTSNSLFISSFEQVKKDKKQYAKAHMDVLQEQDDVYGKILVQQHGDSYVVQNPPNKPLNRQQLDKVYDLPYERTYHPMYESLGGVPAIHEVEFSLTSCRGCFGSCNYCALTYHQGRKVTSRSQENIIKEAELLTEKENFKGYISDVGGPTANFRHASCEKQKTSGVCKDKMCLAPKPCKNLVVDHSEYLELLRKLRKLEKVKKVFIRSGIRFDYLMADKDEAFLKELCQYHVSGQLKVAPEHSQNNVLAKMGKPNFEVYQTFKKKFDELNESLHLKQYLVPYFISSHPGCTLKDAIYLTEYLHSIHYMPEQVQDFYPTPATISTCMYYTGLDPRTMEEVYVPKEEWDKKMQRALLQYRKKENYDIVKQALIKAGRLDLIGFKSECIIKPQKQEIHKFNQMREEENKAKKIPKKTIRHVHKKKGR